MTSSTSQIADLGGAQLFRYPLNITLSLSQPSFHPILSIRIQPYMASQRDTSSNSSSSPSSRSNTGSGSGSGSKSDGEGSPPTVEGSCRPRISLALDLPEGLFVDPDELGNVLLSSGVGWDIVRTNEEREYTGARVDGERMVDEEAERRVRVDIERPSTAQHMDEQMTLRLVLTPELGASEDGEPTTMVRETDADGAGAGRGARVWWTRQVDVPLHGRYLPPKPVRGAASDGIDGKGWEVGQGLIRLPIEEGLRGGWECIQTDPSKSVEPTPSGLPPLQSGSPSYWADLPSIHAGAVDIVLPTGDMADQRLVEGVTALVIWLGWGWLVYKIVLLHMRVKGTAKDKAKAD